MPLEVIELQPLSGMDRVKSIFNSRQPSYEPIQDDRDADDQYSQAGSELGEEETPFSWLEYCVFLLLGVAMLWAWYVSRPPWETTGY